MEIGPGRALSGFVKKTAKEIKCYPVETAQELEAAIAAIRREVGSAPRAALIALTQCCVAWLAAFVLYQLVLIL